MDLQIRAYTKRKNGGKFRPKNIESYERPKIVFVFDTETTTDLGQYLKVGFFQLYVKDCLIQEGFFYDPSRLIKKEKDILFNFSRRNKIEVYTLWEFINEGFYLCNFNLESSCIGYNLKFDISRVSLKHRKAIGNNSEGFSHELTKNSFLPNIITKKIGLDSSIIKFANRKRGSFLDVQKLVSILLERKKISLEKACELLETKTRKIKSKEHGKITEDYLIYLMKDVRSTYEVYLKALEIYESYNINLPITKVHSSASLGKSALRQLGITPFLEQNPDFPDWLLGIIMSTYYGGRTECKIRHKPTKVTSLDFKSMYPTIMLLLDLWKFIIADRIEHEDCTKEIKEFINSLKPSDLLKEELWKKMVVLVQIEDPNGDVLPIRTTYDKKSDFSTIGINYLHYKGKIWYALPDIINSTLQTGKIPNITKSIRFKPLGQQISLKEANILGVDIDPSKENFIKKLVEKRQEIKEMDKPKAQSLKIIANSTSYGIFIQLDPEDKKQDLYVFSNESFETSESKWEKEGEFFNPIIAVAITSGARLLLGMAEKFLSDKNLTHAYMDTDSCMVPPKIAKELSDHFQKLNPYSVDMPIFEVEKENKWFYGISSKRYVLYDLINGKIEINPDQNDGEYKLHGLGHLTNPFGKDENWHVTIWEDILKFHYGILSGGELCEKYKNYRAITKQSVSTYHVFEWFKNLPQVKPYGFFLRGIAQDKRTIPLSSFRDDPQEAVQEKFICMNSGEVKQGQEFWKPLDRTIIDFINHKEHKFNGDIGILKRKQVFVERIEHIGKESNNITNLIDKDKQEFYFNEKEAKEKILKMSNKEAEERGVSRHTLWKIKKKIREGRKINWKTKAVKKFI